MNKFKKLSRVEMRKVAGGQIPEWPCTYCLPGIPGSGPYINDYGYAPGIRLSDAQSYAEGLPCATAGCVYVVCTNPGYPDYSPPYNCNG